MMEDSAFFYTHNENNINTFRIEVRLKEKIEGEALEKAVSVSEKRYPYFCKKVIRSEKGQVALVYNDLPIKVREGKGAVCLGTKEANFHFLSVAYSGETLYFYVYHGLADAAGLMPFIKTVIYYYLTECGHSLSSGGINLADSEIPGEEICDPVPQVPFEGVTPFYSYKSVPHLDLTADGKIAGDKTSVYRIKIREEQVIRYIGRGIMVEINTADNCFTIAFMQSFTGEAYINAFLRLLDEAGIEYTISPPTEIEVCNVETVV
ncbi:MAG: hypothetical protein ACI4KR_10935 [Ruminiclostridium sp.]